MEENKKLVIEDSKKKPEERFDFGALTNEVYLEKYSKLKVRLLRKIESLIELSGKKRKD